MIRVVEDLGAPALVFGVDWATSGATTAKYNRPIGIGLAAAGYLLGGWLGYGGSFMKNVGIASFPWAANAIKSYVQEAGVGSGVAQAASVRPSQRVSRYPAPAYVDQFAGNKLD